MTCHAALNSQKSNSQRVRNHKKRNHTKTKFQDRKSSEPTGSKPIRSTQSKTEIHYKKQKMFACNTKALKKEIDDLKKTVGTLERQLDQDSVPKFLK